MKIKLFRLMLTLLAVTFLAASCGGGGGGGSKKVTLSGLVSDADTGAAVEGAAVTAAGVKGAPTDATGAYSLADLALDASRQFYLSVTKSSYRAYDQLITVPEGTTEVVQNVALTPVGSGVVAGDVTGTVTAAASGDPVGQALVRIEVLGGGGEVVDSLSVHTASDGTFIVTGVPVGNARARVIATGYLEQAQEFTVLAGTATPPLDLQLTSGSTTTEVSGLVRDAATLQPVEGASVQIGQQPVVFSQADGTFTVPDVPVGSQQLTVQKPGYDPYLATLFVTTDMEQVIVSLVSASENPPGGPYSIMGHCYLEGQTDHSGITVQCKRASDGTVEGTYTTGSEGAFGFWVAPGEYILHAEKSGYLPKDVGITLPATGDPVTGVEITLEASGS